MFEFHTLVYAPALVCVCVHLYVRFFFFFSEQLSISSVFTSRNLVLFCTIELIFGISEENTNSPYTSSIKGNEVVMRARLFVCVAPIPTKVRNTR